MIMLKIGSLEIPTLAALDIEQSFELLGGESIFRTVSGAGLKQETWKRTAINTTGSGWLPAGLDTLDRSAPLVLACVTPRKVPAVLATRQATLPTTRRADAGHTPWGIAYLADGSTVRTALSLAGNVATLAAVAGAVAYEAYYLPQFTVWAGKPVESGSRSDASYRWEIACEEI